MNNKDKKAINIVYSTNPNYSYQYNEKRELDTLPPTKQLLRIELDKKHRAGKSVTLITGFIGKKDDLETMAKMLKTKCGVGGSTKNNEVILQGDFRKKAAEILTKEGYKIKLIGL